MRKSLLRGSMLISMLVAAVPACSDATPEGEPVSVSFAEPQDGAVVTGPDVSVVLETRGVDIVSTFDTTPGTGHHHIFIDRDVTPASEAIPAGEPGIVHYGQGQTEFVLENVEPGQRRLIAVVADHLHVPLDPAVADTVVITVVAPGAQP